MENISTVPELRIKFERDSLRDRVLEQLVIGHPGPDMMFVGVPESQKHFFFWCGIISHWFHCYYYLSFSLCNYLSRSSKNMEMRKIYLYSVFCNLSVGFFI
jgi:hypothetical protein